MHRGPPPPAAPDGGELVTRKQLDAAQRLVADSVLQWLTACGEAGRDLPRPTSPALEQAEATIMAFRNQMQPRAREVLEESESSALDYLRGELARIKARQQAAAWEQHLAERRRIAAEAQARGPRLVPDDLAAGSTAGASSGDPTPTPEPAQPSAPPLNLRIPNDDGDFGRFDYGPRRHGYRYAQDITPRGFPR